MSWQTLFRNIELCWVWWKNKRTHDVVRQSKHYIPVIVIIINVCRTKKNHVLLQMYKDIMKFETFFLKYIFCTSKDNIVIQRDLWLSVWSSLPVGNKTQEPFSSIKIGYKVMESFNISCNHVMSWYSAYNALTVENSTGQFELSHKWCIFRRKSIDFQHIITIHVIGNILHYDGLHKMLS